MTDKVKQKSNNDKMKKRNRTCKICGTRKGFVRKYKIGICRRCFKDNAERIGFRKYEWRKVILWVWLTQ